MLVLLIPSKESVISDNIDVYLAPLIEELLQLWEGIMPLMYQANLRIKHSLLEQC
jgi:hypothetical protein